MDLPQYVISPLTAAEVELNLARLLELDQGTPGEPWFEEHWRRPLPGKWQLSLLARGLDGVVVGFIVVSRKAGALHAHRMAVDARCRRHGLGFELLRAVVMRARAESVRLTAKTDPANGAVHGLLVRLGLQIVGCDRHVLWATPGPSDLDTGEVGTGPAAGVDARLQADRASPA